ncbi:hypothetical protein CGLO_14655 [Colletotrichum gloeosporioides Cg-14]|uniref:Uncharacterized protein n=1 Tax=Colletotrichum gloeosporioides (strain Cg-14) TaxID=1237896 RepID=T0JT62_COLGC|nr:hypothetical protein CGLO_14655 [Colletotrichum gloeosporioides Cg-14]
MIIFMMFE